MATLKDVADLAGVSAATVSLALNNGPVNQKTRQRVIDCARRLNYVPNRIGQILAAGKSKTIEFLMMTSDRYTDTVRRTTLFYYLLEGVLSVADEANYSLRFSVKSHDDTDLQGYFDRIVGDSSVDGVIIVPQFLREYPFVSTLKRSGFPYVMLQPPRFGDTVNFVDMDNHTGGAMVARLFRQHGYRRIALINGPAGHLDAIERERGFTDTLAGAGTHRFAKRYGDFTIGSGYAAMAELLTEFAPDAVFCGNDYMAAGAMKLLHERGLRIPDDVAVVGYDNSDIGPGLAPSLTSVDNRFFDLGRALAGGLLSLVKGRAESVREVLTPALVERASHERTG